MKKRILLAGGLGNQMFQYAFYLSLKNKGVPCKIDYSYFYVVKMHNGFELPYVFDIEHEPEKPKFIHRQIISLLRSLRPTCITYCDKAYKYCADVYYAKQPVLIGDWLSTKYFEDIENQIVKTYTFRNIGKRNIALSKDMKHSNSVSIHIRRGDYLNLPNYCVCDDNYYKSAIYEILKNVENPVFYIFSNEPSWCESFMSQFGVNFKIVDWNQGKDSYQDMYLMTQCKHNIIANSTFSWWGAWLNQNENKIVVAPTNWFRNNNDNINCPEWLLIDTAKSYGK